MIYTNKKMSQVLQTIKLNNSSITDNENSSGSFVELNGCYLLADKDAEFDQLNIDSICRLYGDRTGFEAFNNHIHIKGIELALVKMNEWKNKLNADFPGQKFHLVLAYDGNESSLRFYKYRENEGSWVNLKDLESYKDEAILVMDI